MFGVICRKVAKLSGLTTKPQLPHRHLRLELKVESFRMVFDKAFD